MLNRKEREYVFLNYLDKSHQEIADHLGVSLGTVRGFVDKHHLVKYEAPADWTEEETKFLVDHMDALTTFELAVSLNKTEAAINTKRVRIRRKRGDDPAKTIWTEEMVEYLKENYLYKSHSEMAKHLGLPTHAVRGKCRRERLLKRPREKSV